MSISDDTLLLILISCLFYVFCKKCKRSRERELALSREAAGRSTVVVGRDANAANDINHLEWGSSNLPIDIVNGALIARPHPLSLELGDTDTIRPERRSKEAIELHFDTVTLEKNGESVQTIRAILAAARDSVTTGHDSLTVEEASDEAAVITDSSSSSKFSSSSKSKGMYNNDDNALYRDEECSVCLTTYEVGDEICWAKIDNCDHIFHKECVLAWLAHNDDCPLCRTNLFRPSSSTNLATSL